MGFKVEMNTMVCMAAKIIAKKAAHRVWVLRPRIFCVPDK